MHSANNVNREIKKDVRKEKNYTRHVVTEEEKASEVKVLCSVPRTQRIFLPF